MKQLLNSFKIENLKNNLKEVIKRFPVSMIIIVIISTLYFTLNHGDFSNIEGEKIGRFIFSLTITFFASVGLYLNAEGKNTSTLKKNILQIVAIIFGVFFYIGFDRYIDDFQNIIFFMLTLFGIISFIFFAPYTKNFFTKENKQSVFYTYFYNVSIVFLTSVILGIILFVLGSIGILSVFALFDISWDEFKIISDWSTISLFIIAHIFALTKLPSKKSFSESHFNENVFFSFLVKYIAIPFIYVYFIILYAYSIKVLANFSDWPKGSVSWMVIGFSIFGYITYVFSYIFEEVGKPGVGKNKFISFFRKMFPFIVIPQIFMLFYAIYLRIAQYDITTNRYFVVVFGLWLLTISLYYVFSKKKYLNVMFAILTLFIIIISIGPWSVYNLPEKRQYKVLISNLKEAKILENGKINPLKKYNDINNNLSHNIYSGINYLCDFNNCESIKNLFPEQYKELLKKDKKEFGKIVNRDKESKKIIYIEPNRWKVIDHITNSIKVKYYYGNENNENPTIYFYLKDSEKVFPIEVSGYSKVIRISDYHNDGIEKYAKINLVNKKIDIINSEETVSIDINEMINNILENYKKSENTKLSKEEMTYEIGKYKIILESIGIANPNYDGENKNNYSSTSGYVLIK